MRLVGLRLAEITRKFKAFHINFFNYNSQLCISIFSFFDELVDDVITSVKIIEQGQ